MTPAVISEDTERAIERIYNYMTKARQTGEYEITEDGIMVTIPTLMMQYLENWTSVVRGEKRFDFDDINDDTGVHRISEGIIGKAAECACRIAGPAIPLERATSEFNVDFTVYEKMSEGNCYDCDLNDTVTVKTAGEWCRENRILSWMAATGDVIRSAPEGKRAILCRYMGDNKILIMGWVNATDLVGKWNNSVSLKTKMAIYFNDGNFMHRGKEIKVYGGGVASVIHPITEELNESCDNERHTLQHRSS